MSSVGSRTALVSIAELREVSSSSGSGRSNSYGSAFFVTGLVTPLGTLRHPTAPISAPSSLSSSSSSRTSISSSSDAGWVGMMGCVGASSSQSLSPSSSTAGAAWVGMMASGSVVTGRVVVTGCVVAFFTGTGWAFAAAFAACCLASHSASNLRPYSLSMSK